MGLDVRKYDANPGGLEFQLLFNEIKAYTLVGRDRCFMLYQLAKYADAKEGEIAEVGVYKGGTGKLIAKTCPKKPIHLFDTFSGMPATDETKDKHRKDDFNDTSLKSVKKYLGDCENIRFYQGFFPDTSGPVANTKFCFAHIDVDIYQSVKDSLEFFYHRMVQGGIMVFDDYGWKTCPGVKKAISEFLLDKVETPIMTTRYQCMLIKI